MTAQNVVDRILNRLDEDGAGYYSAAEVLAAVNEAQRQFVLLTLCLESAVTLWTLSAGVGHYHMLTIYPNWILPLRIRSFNTTKVLPCRLTDLDAMDPAWRLDTGTATRYSHLGFDLLSFNKLPPGPNINMYLNFAYTPAVMVLASTPEIPEVHHGSLIDYAIPILRIKEGGQGFIQSLPYFERFLTDAAKLADFMRLRNRSQGYDRGPYEITHFDRSRLLAAMATKAEKTRAR